MENNIKLSHMSHWKTIPYKTIDNFYLIEQSDYKDCGITLSYYLSLEFNI